MTSRLEPDVDPSHLRAAHFRLRTPEEALRLAPLIASMLPDPNRQHLGVVELVMNAIEHGNLEFDGESKQRLLREHRWPAELQRRLAEPAYGDRYVDVHVERTRDAVELLISDQGNGFAWQAYSGGSLDAFDAPLGRGIALARGLAFDEVTYLGKGNRVLAKAYARERSTTAESAPASAPPAEDGDPSGVLGELSDCITNDRSWSRVRSLLERLRARVAHLENERDRVARDNELAQRVISKMLRSNRAALPGVRSFLEPLDAFSGDAVLVAKTPSGRLRWLLADFVGHGLAAALGSIPLASAFHATAQKSVPFHEVVLTLNDVVRSTLPTELFCGAVICEYDRRTGELTAWNGGMPPLLVLGPGDEFELVDSEHLPLGVVPSADIQVELLRAPVPDGAHVIAFSDGIIEAQNASGEQFGVERTLRELTGSRCAGASELWTAVHAFTVGAPRRDDMSILEVCPSEWARSSSLGP